MVNSTMSAKALALKQERNVSLVITAIRIPRLLVNYFLIKKTMSARSN